MEQVGGIMAGTSLLLGILQAELQKYLSLNKKRTFVILYFCPKSDGWVDRSVYRCRWCESVQTLQSRSTHPAPKGIGGHTTAGTVIRGEGGKSHGYAAQNECEEHS
jgi:hypothetical protein